MWINMGIRTQLQILQPFNMTTQVLWLVLNCMTILMKSFMTSVKLHI